MATNNFYRTPHLTTVSFAVGVLLFFLPFMEIKCNGTTIAGISGTDMVTGASPKVNKDLDNMATSFGKNDTTITETGKQKKDGKVYALAIIALALGVIGLVTAVLKKGIYNNTEMLVGILGAVALLALFIQVKSDISQQIKNTDKTADTLTGMINVSVDFTIWFVLCLLSYLAAAFFSYKQKDLVASQVVPPSNAPQVPINNPGDQSDFPAGLSGEEESG